MPREIIGTQPGRLVYQHYDEPALKAGQIRVKTQFAAPKHGTELHGFRAQPNQASTYYDEAYQCFLPASNPQEGPRPPFRPGNMWVGRIVELGPEVKDWALGERVAGYGPLKETHVVQVDAQNVAGSGAINDLLRVPEEMSWQAAVCYDPCQFALAGVRDSRLRLGDVCCVMGLGAIGLMAAQMARLQGARLVIVCDPIEKRRQIALENGADCAIDPARQDAGLEIKKLTDGMGADAIIETSGTYPALQAALRGVAYAGRIAVVGWYNPCKGAFDLGQEAHMNNATLFFSRACSEPNPDYPRWSWARINASCWALLSKGLLKCDNVIDPVVPFDQAAQAYCQCVDQDPARSVKMGVTF